jgi:hypothetical protein
LKKRPFTLACSQSLFRILINQSKLLVKADYLVNIVMLALSLIIIQLKNSIYIKKLKTLGIYYWSRHKKASAHLSKQLINKRWPKPLNLQTFL